MTSLACHDSNTPTLAVMDPRGLPVRIVAYCREHAIQIAESRITRQAFNAAGQKVASWDPRLWEDSPTPNVATVHGLSGQTLLTNSVDAGWKVDLLNDASSSLVSWDSRGSQRQNEYDWLQRPVTISEQLASESQLIVERLIYGTASTEFSAHNQCGQRVRHDHAAGSQLWAEYTVSGVPIVEVLRFLKRLDTPDWPLALPMRDALLEDGAGYVSHHSYYAAGAMRSETDAGNNLRSFTYTLAGELKEVRLKLAGVGQSTHVLVSDIHYNASGQAESETAGNGVVTTSQYSADDGRLIRLSSGVPGFAPHQDLHYHYDPVGNICRLEDKAQLVRHFKNQRTDPSNSYCYDSLYQLVKAHGRQVASSSHGPALPSILPTPLDANQLINYTQSFSYDASGNLLSRHHSGAPALNMAVSKCSNRCLTVFDETSPPDEEAIVSGFDAAGNQLQLTRGQVMSWNARNQLHRVTMVVREDGPDDLEFYVYGERSERLRKVRLTQTSSRTLRAEVRYLKGLEIHIDNASGEERHVLNVRAGQNQVRVLHWETMPPKDVIQDQRRFGLTDLLGSCTAELDENARLINQEGFYPYGGTAWWAGVSSLETKYKTRRYSGMERDAAGLYYYGYRYYAPWLQRWMCPDPAGDVEGLNRYLMAVNNPVSFFDADGLFRTPITERTSKSRLSYHDPDLQERFDLADEATKKRLDVVKENLIHTAKPKHEFQSVSRYDPSVYKPDSFTNVFERHTWTFEDNYRNPDSSNYFANDVAKFQYDRVSKAGGFFGHLPSIIRRWAVSNRQTLQVTRNMESGSSELLEAFMNKTVNGKSTQRILDDFGLRAIRVDFADDTFDVYVEPVTDEIVEYDEISYLERKNTISTEISHSSDTESNHSPELTATLHAIEEQPKRSSARKLSIS
ncbi:insecticidal toxin complex protein TccC [Pseudomonas sp. IT-P100]|uniref:RHS repeat domain-containing protein n=1 Tax=Pseudomonas sp. IT-P100 TaxID=3026452 RepID=UPI0039E09DFE